MIYYGTPPRYLYMFPLQDYAIYLLYPIGYNRYTLLKLISDNNILIQYVYVLLNFYI